MSLQSLCRYEACVATKYAKVSIEHSFYINGTHFHSLNTYNFRMLKVRTDDNEMEILERLEKLPDCSQVNFNFIKFTSEDSFEQDSIILNLATVLNEKNPVLLQQEENFDNVNKINQQKCSDSDTDSQKTIMEDDLMSDSEFQIALTRCMKEQEKRKARVRENLYERYMNDCYTVHGL